MSNLIDAQPQYVQTKAAFASLMDHLLDSDCVALDTEFVSEGSYEPDLCLIQVALADGIWIVDPFAISNLRDFWLAVTAPERELLVFAAREEIRFCLRGCGRAPAKMLDLQLAAGLLGYGYPLSHTNMVRKVLGVAVSGSETFTDWRRRPLSLKQIDYAADDVRYLFAVRQQFREEAERLERLGWLEDECARLVARVAEGEQEERWWKLAGRTSLSRRELAVLRELWRWRDDEARSANLPPRRVMRDELLVEIAKRKPTTTGSLHELRGMERGSIRSAGPLIVQAVKMAMELPDAELPRLRRREDPPQVGILAQLLAVATNTLAEKNRVDAQLLATAADLQQLVRWRLASQTAVSEEEEEEREEPLVIQGWRGEILRHPLLQILDGKRCARVTDLNSSNPLVFEPHPTDE